MSSVVERRQHLRLVLDNLQTAHQEWVESDRQALYSDDPFALAIDETIEVFGTGELPAGFQSILRTVDQLREQWAAYQRSLEGSHSPWIVPGNGFWKTLEHLLSQFQTAVQPPRKVLEPIPVLKEQRVSDRQICVIYGWVDSEGRPELWKLQEELAKPGTHVNESFIPPHEKARREREQRQQESYARLRERQQRKIRSLSTPGPEDFARLVADGVSAKQIATIKRISIEEVYAQCDALGLPLPKESYDTVGRGPHDPDLTPEASNYFQARRGDEASEHQLDQAAELEALDIDEYGDPDNASDQASGDGQSVESTGPDTGAMTLEQEIVMYHKQGMRPGDIARAVSVPEKEVSLQRVNAVIARFNSAPDDFT